MKNHKIFVLLAAAILYAKPVLCAGSTGGSNALFLASDGAQHAPRQYNGLPVAAELFILIVCIALVITLILLMRKNRRLVDTQKSLHTAEEILEKEKLIQKAKQQSGKIIDIAPVMYVLTVDSKVIDSNRYAQEAVGIYPGYDIRAFCFDSDNYNRIIERLKNEDNIFSEYIQFITKTSEIDRFLINISQIEYESGTGVFFWGISIEKNERQKDTAERLQKDMQMLIDALPVPLFIFEPASLTTMYGNSAYAQMLGYESLAAIIGQDVSSMLLSEESGYEQDYDETLMDLVDTVINSEEPIEKELKHLSPAGETINTKAICTNFVYKGINSILVIMQDISAEIKKAEMLESMAEKEREANELKGRFIVNMSHEIRTPLNAIIGLLEIELSKSADSEYSGMFKKIQGSARILNQIVAEILEFSRTETEIPEIVEDAFALEDVLADALLVASQTAGDKDIEILADISGSLPDILIGDRPKLWKILKNILENSAKFTNEGTITLSALPGSKSQNGRINIIFTVADTGIGIKPSQLPRIFIPFEQFGDSPLKNEGTGLGMAVTKGLIDAMGGNIDIVSNYGAGTSVTVELPFTLIDGVMSIAEKNTYPYLENRRVLVADSNEFARNVAVGFLNSVNMKAYGVSNAAEAEMALQNAKSEGSAYEIALIDYFKPDGRQICGLVNTTDSGRPRIIQMASFAKYISSEIGVVPRKNFVEKPFTPTLLIDKICGVLEINSEKEFSTTSIFPGAKVLLCEDNAINQDVVVGMLQIFGIEPAVAENGAEAISCLEEENYDLVFMDILMPVMSGHEATVKIRSSGKPYRDVPIVAMTANALKEEIDKCFAEGMNGHIIKPIDAERLYSELLKWLPCRSRALSAAPGGLAAAETAQFFTAYDIPEIDASDGLKRFANKRDRYEKALRRFSDELEICLGEIKRTLEAGDYSYCREIVHKIKGVAGNLGAKKLFEQSARLETALIDKQTDDTALKEFDECANAILSGLKRAFRPQNENAPGKSEGSLDEAKALLEELNSRVARFDPENSEKAVGLLRQKHWQLIDENILNEIFAMVENYQFEEAEEHINKLLEEL